MNASPLPRPPLARLPTLLVGQEYQPLVGDLVLSLQDLGMTVEELGD